MLDTREIGSAEIAIVVYITIATAITIIIVVVGITAIAAVAVADDCDDEGGCKRRVMLKMKVTMTEEAWLKDEEMIITNMVYDVAADGCDDEDLQRL